MPGVHELSLLDGVRATVLEQARLHRAGRITRISLRIGALAGVEAEALAFAFAVVMAGTIAADACLDLETVAAVCFCQRCRQEFPAVDGGCECPRCGEISRTLLRGRELQLVAVDLD